jgi:hypothetical protein
MGFYARESPRRKFRPPLKGCSAWRHSINKVAETTELNEIIEEAKRVDQTLYRGSLIEARKCLVEMEERLRELRAESLPDTIATATESKLQAEEVGIEEQINRIKLNSLPNSPSVLREQCQVHLDRVRQELKGLEERRLKSREERVRRLIELRQQIVSQEYKIASLERERTIRWEEDERRREAALDRIQMLEGDSSAGGDRPQRAIQRKLEALQREIAELRREMQRQRPDKKE